MPLGWEELNIILGASPINLSVMLRTLTKSTGAVCSRAVAFYSTSSAASTPASPPATESVQTRAEIVSQQAPNRKETWAPSQKPRSEAMTGVRFEQRDMGLQPRPYAAIDLIAKEPIRYLHAHSAVCDGGKGSQQGHPKIYINIDKPGSHACQYCGIRYANEKYRQGLEEGKLPNLI